jgi:ribosomal protein S18 acetylase RimI-like enzyme
VESTAILDQLIANAWPAAELEMRGGWRFRWTSGVTRRANSVLPVGNAARLEELVEFGEEYYRRRGGVARFQVSAASAPEGLDRYLLGRGYVPDTRTFVMTAEVERLIYSTAPGVWATTTSDVVTDPWFECYWTSDPSQRLGSEHARICRETLLMATAPSEFVLLEEGADAVAVGQVVIEGTWGGLQCIATVESHRRRGAAVAVLHRLASAARATGAERCYLAVTADNVPALGLYRRCGFGVAHEYTYYVR